LLDHFVNCKREGRLVGKQVRSSKSVKVNKVLHVSERGVDFELYIPL
jgi:hypothetical protein